MHISITRALLAALRTQLEDESRIIAIGRRKRRQNLITQIDKLLTRQFIRAPAPELLHVIRRQWSHDSRVRICEQPFLRSDADGNWLSCWLWVGTGAGSSELIDPARLAAAISSLPHLAGAVFTLHCRDNLDYSSIGRRLGITVETVQAELAAALRALDEALDDEAPNPIA